MIPLSNPTLICPTLSNFWTENVASSHSLWRFAEAPWLLASAHWAPGFKEIDLRHRKSGAHQTISASKYMGLILGIWWTGLEEWKKCLQISAGTIENQDPRVNFPDGLWRHVQNWSLRILRLKKKNHPTYIILPFLIHHWSSFTHLKKAPCRWGSLLLHPC